MVRCSHIACFAFIAASLLLGCGGGNEPPSPTPAPAPSPTNPSPPSPSPAPSPSPGPIEIDVSVSGSVTADIRARIASFNSITGSSADGKGLLIPADGKNAALVLAMSAQRQPLLLGYQDGSSKVLSAETTAHALARLALGSLPPDTDLAAVDLAIRNSPSLPIAAAAVQTSLSAGQMPYRDSTVMTAILRALDDAELPLPDALASRARPMALPPQAVQSLPYNLYEDVNGSRVTIVEANAGQAKVKNTSLIAWAAQRLDESGATIYTLPTPIPALTLVRLAAGVPPAELNGVSAARYAVRLYHSPESKAENMKAAMKDAVEVTLFPVNLPPETSLLIEKAIDNAFAAYAAVVHSADIGFVQNFLVPLHLKSIVTSLVPEVDAGFLNGLREILFDGFATIVPAVETPKRAWTMANFLNRVRQTVNTSNDNRRVAVCLNETGNLVSCNGMP